jgi:hypothetical protein
MSKQIIAIFNMFLEEGKRKGYRRSFVYAFDNTLEYMNMEREKLFSVLRRAYNINNKERELWIDNNEEVYNAWKQSRMTKKDFIKNNKNWLDSIILAIIL